MLHILSVSGNSLGYVRNLVCFSVPMHIGICIHNGSVS